MQAASNASSAMASSLITDEQLMRVANPAKGGSAQSRVWQQRKKHVAAHNWNAKLPLDRLRQLSTPFPKLLVPHVFAVIEAAQADGARQHGGGRVVARQGEAAALVRQRRDHVPAEAVREEAPQRAVAREFKHAAA
eukprot:2056715-Pleurochrysis_carterae.AAC.3